MPPTRVAALTVLAMVAFASNSLLCRMALRSTSIDPASFTSVRLASGAVVLWLIVWLRKGSSSASGNWWSALALAVYAVAFSFAYKGLTAATGALVLFGAVQATMIGVGLWRGERLGRGQIAGLMLAISGLVILLLPGLSAPPLVSAFLMLSAGAAWGVYSLRGKSLGDPVRVSAGNFLRAVPIAALVSLVAMAAMHGVSLPMQGAIYAVASGALASGLGYVIWYSALPALSATNAAAVQLSVPVLTALGGVVLLDEAVTARLVVASAAILSGIALVITSRVRTR